MRWAERGEHVGIKMKNRSCFVCFRRRGMMNCFKHCGETDYDETRHEDH